MNRLVLCPGAVLHLDRCHHDSASAVDAGNSLARAAEHIVQLLICSRSSCHVAIDPWP